jgi:hypothetical protein
VTAPLAVTVASRQLLPKADTAPSECEDSIAIDISRLRFAVSDGATEGFDSRRWARYLTRAWVSPSSGALDTFDFIDRVRALGERLEEKWAGRRLPWYLEEKASAGAFAAFLGLQITPEWTWSALALGDCCLIIERDRTLAQAFPLSSPDDFSNRPILVASKTDRDASKQALRLGQGVCLPGDTFLLMSDAIACWYLGHATSNRELLDDFHSALCDTSALVALMARERTSRRLRNDDVAVIKLVLGAAENGV